MKKHLQNFLYLAIFGIFFGLNVNQSMAQTPASFYCAPGNFSTCCEFINSVTFNGVSRISGKTTAYYRDYSSTALTTVNKNTTYTLSVNVGSPYSTDIVGAWIDWNQDRDFDDAGESYTLTGGNSTTPTATINITVPSTAVGGTTVMRVRLQDGGTRFPCGSSYSSQWGNVDDYAINIFEPTAITTNLSSTPEVRCTSSGNRVLTVAANGGGLNYQWERSTNGGANWSVVQTGTSASYSVPVSTHHSTGSLITAVPETRENRYRCLVFSSFGWGNVYTNTSIIQSNEQVNATLAPLTAACQNNVGTMVANVTGSFSSLQWQKSTDGSTYTNIPGANSNTLTFQSTQLSDAGFYRILVANSASCGGTQFVSQATNFQVVQAFSIVSQPSSVVIGCIGKDPVNFTIQNTGTVFSYQWQISLDRGQTWNNVVGNPTANTRQLTFIQPNKNQIGWYRCQMTYATCSGTDVLNAGPYDYQVYNSFTINEQPKEQQMCEGQTAVLPVVAVGTVYGYRWYKDGVLLTLQDNPYANSAILYIENIKHNQAGVYTCEIDAENCANGRGWIPTQDVLVYVKRGTQITEIDKEVEVMIGGTATMSIQAHVAPIPPKMLVGIQWYKGTTPLVNNDRIAGAKSSILTIRNVNANDFANDYWVVVEGLCTSDTATAISLKEATTPVITIDPVVGVSECAGKTAILNATATMNVAGNLNYQWRANGSPIADGAKYTGTKTMMLTVNNLEAADEATKFDVVVTSVDGKTTATSNEAQITVKPLAVLDTKSDDVISVETDKELKVFVNMTTTLTLSYQWYLDDGLGNVNAITGANTNELTIAAAKATDAGIYMVEVKSECDDQMITVSEVTVTAATNDDVTSVERGSLDLNITPNPTSDNVNVNLAGIEYNVITITNTLGEVLFTTNEKTNLLNIDVNNLALSNGLYFINVIGNNTNRTGRFVVNK